MRRLVRLSRPNDGGFSGVPSLVLGAQSCGHSQDDKHRLRNFFRRSRAAGPSQRDGIDHIHVTGQQCRKRLIRVPMGVLPQQFPVSRFLHLPMNVRRRRKVPVYFISRSKSIQPQMDTDKHG
jgi:hypothetical protein